MKYIFSLILLLQSFTFSTVFATCEIEIGWSIKDAWQFLADCGQNTIWINPWSAGSQYTVLETEAKQKIIDIANNVISLWALLAVGAIVWSGIQYTKAFGEDEKLKKAKTTGIYSLIGLILLLISFGIVDIFINFIYTITGN